MSGCFSPAALKDVDDFAFGSDRLCDQLPQGVIEVFARLSFARRAPPASVRVLVQLDFSREFCREGGSLGFANHLMLDRHFS